MPLENASYPKDLVTSNPAASDGMNNADDHMRMIKACLKNALAGVSGALTRSVGLTSFAIQPPAGTSTDPAYTFAEETTLGFYRSAAGVIELVGGRLKNAAPVGGLHQFLVEPTGLGKGGTGTGHEYLELDGSTWPNSAFPALAAHLGQGGTSFTLPNAYATGRFLRSRTAAVAAGTLQSNTVGPHTHPDVTKTTGVESADHTHSGTTGSMNQNASHSHSVNNHSYWTTNAGSGVGGGGSFGVAGTTSISINAANTDHQHPFTTGGRSATHTHQVTVDTPANTGTTETRPEALSVVLCIKT